MKFLLPIFLLMSCGTVEKKTEAEEFSLNSKFDLYANLTKEMEDENGWLNFHCDSVGFNSLYMTVAGGRNVLLALDSTGRLWRTVEKQCLKKRKSKSTISLDMVVMWLHWVWENKAWAELNSFIDKMEASNGKIGDHDGSADGLSRIHMYKNPQLMSLVYRVKWRLGGNKHWSVDKISQSWDPKYGFPGHLLALRAWLYQKINWGKMPSGALKALRKQSEWNPENALFKAMLSVYDSNYKCPTDILSNEQYFPKDRLPTTRDRKTPYLWERDLGSDYKPKSGKSVKHTGLDFMIAASICMRKF